MTQLPTSVESVIYDTVYAAVHPAYAGAARGTKDKAALDAMGVIVDIAGQIANRAMCDAICDAGQGRDVTYRATQPEQPKHCEFRKIIGSVI